MQTRYRDFVIRDWQPGDRSIAAELIRLVLAEYNLGWDPDGTDWDAHQVEDAYWKTGGEFWVIEHQDDIVGTGGYYPAKRGINAVEIRKMYLLPQARGQGLGRYLLQTLEVAIAEHGFQQIWVETATVLQTAVKLYERSGYQPSTGVATCRCDRIYVKELNVKKLERYVKWGESSATH